MSWAMGLVEACGGCLARFAIMPQVIVSTGHRNGHRERASRSAGVLLALAVGGVSFDYGDAVALRASHASAGGRPQT